MKKVLKGFAALAIAGISCAAVGQTTIPYSNSFEAYNQGDAITNVDGSWTASATAYITNNSYLNTSAMNTPYMGAPLVGEAHTKVLSFSDGYLTNAYSGTSGQTLISIDTMIQPALSMDLPVADAAISNSHFSICFLTNGVAVWHGVQNSPMQGSSYAQWSTLNASTTPISSQKWCRLTITLNYHALPYDGIIDVWNAMFQVKIDGQPLTSPYGFVTADSSTGNTNGSWLCMAQLTAPINISSLALNGSGMIDDLNVQASDAPQYVTDNHGIPYNWMVMMGVTNDTSSNAMAAAASNTADADNDGMPNWQEYLAGTAPTNPASKLVILSATLSNGVPVVTWMGSSQALADYTLAASTNLLDSNGWTNLMMSARHDGTNSATLTGAPVSTVGFLRVSVVK